MTDDYDTDGHCNECAKILSHEPGCSVGLDRLATAMHAAGSAALAAEDANLSLAAEGMENRAKLAAEALACAVYAAARNAYAAALAARSAARA